MVIIELDLVKGEVHPGAGFCPPPPAPRLTPHDLHVTERLGADFFDLAHHIGGIQIITGGGF